MPDTWFFGTDPKALEAHDQLHREITLGKP
jgi:hypothetical protein